MQKIKHVIGVDEAGRGPLAGPVAVGMVVVPADFDWTLIPGVGDSKQVSAENREAIFRRTRALARAGTLAYTVSLVGASTIDRIGITKAVALGIERCFLKLKPDPLHTKVLLDGLLHAPPPFVYQETIVKGDAKEKVIGLASICAKVTRDSHMVRVARDHPQYHFDIHKGYGTKMHSDAIHAHGLAKIHRRSFTKRFQ